MKMVKSLILGSAAGLVAMSGAQAADLPVKAKAVEYVRICSLYGAGFYYIPGTDTCIKIGGYVRAETAFNTNSTFNGAYNAGGGARNRYSNTYVTRARQDLNMDTRTATEYGVVRTFTDVVFTWTSGVYGAAAAPAGTAYAGDGIGGGTLGVYHAFIQFAGFTVGRTISIFDTPWTNYPGNNFDGLVGGSGDVTGVNQLTYTAALGNGVSLAVSAQESAAYYTTNIWNTSFGGVSAATPQTLPNPTPAATFASTYGPTFATGVYGTPSIAAQRLPDFVGQLRVDQAWGLFQASIASHHNHPTYYTATNEASGHPDSKVGWAGQLALSIKNIPTGVGDSINIQGAYAVGASRYVFQSLVPTNWAMYGGSGAGGYQSLGLAGVSDAVFANGSQLELTTSYGIRGAFNHNWDPYWTSSIYGAWAAMSYNTNAKAMICDRFAGAAPTLVPGAGFACNPDFTVAQIGSRTAWTPVKNLTFSGDVVYTHLDQKHSGLVTIPAVTAIGKPTAVYELRDQNTWTFLARAQRVF